MRRFFSDNGLSLVVFSLFLAFLFGESLAGHRAYNQDQLEHGQSPVRYGEYLRSGEFLESTLENC